MAVIKFLCLFVLIPLFSCRQINFLPFEKVKAYLNDDPTSDYEVVSLVHTLHKRSLPSTVRIRAFQKDIELYLEPNENYLFGNNTPVYLSYRGTDRKNSFKPISHDEMALYHDLENNAALVVEKKEDKHLMYGIIGDYMIRPSPSNEQLLNRNKRSSSSKNILTARDNEIFADNHVLIKINQSEKSHIEKPGTLNRSERSIWTPISSLWKSSDDTKLDRIYPEILVTADNNYFKKFGGNVKEFIKYQAVFWNGVDLLFRYFESPEIRLNIAGIVISQEPSADIYGESNVKGNQLSILEFLDTFQYTRSIHDDDFPKISYDLVIALTNYELVDEFSSEKLDVATFGISTLEVACSKVATAVVRDVFAFQGVSVAAHEIGHLLGAVHDMDRECKAHVPVADYLMSYFSMSENQFRWSACSLKYIEDFLKSDGAKCLRNEPIAIISPYTKFLPGKIADVDAQCENFLPGSKAVQITGESVCQRLSCRQIRVNKTGRRYPHVVGMPNGALEGSSCENGGICIQGDCVQIEQHQSSTTSIN